MATEHVIIVRRAIRARRGLFTIPDLSIDVGDFHDLSQYVPSGYTVVSSELLGLNTNLATYNTSTMILTGIAGGIMRDLQLSVEVT